MNMCVKDFLLAVILSLSIGGLILTNAVREDEMVESWAGKLGDELWELGQLVTKSPEIRTSYTKLNARVLPTDGEGILNGIVSNVGRLMKQKMNALRCIITEAEYLSQNITKHEAKKASKGYKYYNSIYSSFNDISEDKNSTTEEDDEEGNDDEEEDEVDQYINKLASEYFVMDLEENNHFYGIKVNTSFSSVHLPLNIYDKENDTLHAIIWSEGLDKQFINNYESDSTISWQYFCSPTGILRHFPAYHWMNPHDKFDCRTRTWYTEAATCSKELVIMVDRSGSMTGIKKTIAKLVVQTILQTLSNNDFLNIYVFNKTVQHIIECFPNETLVQATPENLKMFDYAINRTVLEDKLFLEPALVWAFKVLANSRSANSCPNEECTQAVILITDGIADNVTHIFEKHNWLGNNSVLPARLFVYVTGREGSGLSFAQNMACLNKGHYASVKHLEDVREEVLKYITFLAKPKEEDVHKRSLSWSHIFVDATGIDEEEKNIEYRMMTSVIGSAFNWKSINSNKDKIPHLIGVAGIDVLIDDIKKLTLPYKIGANGYSFLITNNGYLMFHPDHRPVEHGILKDNFNSFDLTEVELYDDNVTEPRVPNEIIINLREAMVKQEYGSMDDVDMKFHYDNMRRIGVESRHYYYAPLENTPFSLGLVLPHSYGSYWIKAGDEIKKSIQMGIPLTDHFRGNWRIHPKWVYCDYHRTNLEFETQEEKLQHFLEKMFIIHEWKWKDQFDVFYTNKNDSIGSDCEDKVPITDNDYYCDKDLMQLLVFDAKVTENAYKDSEWSAKNRREEELAKQFGVSVRFVATQSGLTRWQHIPSLPSGTKSFGDLYFMSLEETWYKSAVLFHQTDPDAFVYSVPFSAGSQSEPMLTASYAIFPRDGGNEAPGSVVGFQMLHSGLLDRFKDITSKTQSFDNPETCASDVLDCYIVDSNGYVVISEIHNDTGKFFGELEGAVMESMVAKNIFRKIPLFDYQGICFPDDDRKSGIDFLKTPLHLMKQMLLWFVAKFIWIIISMNELVPAYAQVNEATEEDMKKILENIEVKKVNVEEEEEEIEPESCDRSGMLYLMQPVSRELDYTATTNCSRPFFVKRIPKTNLLLIVVNTLYQSCYRKLSASMKRIYYDNEGFTEPGCHKLSLNSLTRRRPTQCYSIDPMDYEPERCKGSAISTQIIPTLIIIYLFHYTFLRTV